MMRQVRNSFAWSILFFVIFNEALGLNISLEGYVDSEKSTKQNDTLGNTTVPEIESFHGVEEEGILKRYALFFGLGGFALTAFIIFLVCYCALGICGCCIECCCGSEDTQQGVVLPQPPQPNVISLQPIVQLPQQQMQYFPQPPQYTQTSIVTTPIRY